MGGPVAPALVFASVFKSLFMIQLLSRKNKKGAAFLKRQRLMLVYLVVK